MEKSEISKIINLQKRNKENGKNKTSRRTERGKKKLKKEEKLIMVPRSSLVLRRPAVVSSMLAHPDQR
jgi:hypothetical protein